MKFEPILLSNRRNTACQLHTGWQDVFAHAMTDRHAYIVMGCACSRPAHRLPSLAVVDLKIFSVSIEQLCSETLGRFPHSDSRTVTHVGRATRPVRLLPAAAHEL